MKLTFAPSTLGVFLSIAIIAIRAFSRNSLPIEDWSIFSWFLMLLPAYFPWFLLGVFYSFWAIGLAMVGIFLGIRGFIKKM